VSAEIVLINLDRSPDRLAFMSDQLGRLGLAFTRLSATDGSHIAQDEFDRLSRTYMRPITRSELGCLTSHVQAWRHCAETGRSILVLEDDVLLSGRLRDFLDEVETLDLPGLINLETRGTDKRVSRNPVAATKSGIRLYRLLIDNGGTAAYVVSP
jgi:glycosyl transferase family 25